MNNAALLFVLFLFLHLPHFTSLKTPTTNPQQTVTTLPKNPPNITVIKNVDNINAKKSKCKFKPSPTANQRLTSEYKRLIDSGHCINYRTSTLLNPPNTTTGIVLSPLTSSLLTWQFTFLGPPSTPFSRGVYTGRIVFPKDYPGSPPGIFMVGESGRWGRGRRICLSVTDFHVETWDVRWNVLSLVEGLRVHMSSDLEGEIGSVHCSELERRVIAEKSREWVYEKNGKVLVDHGEILRKGCLGECEEMGRRVVEKVKMERVLKERRKEGVGGFKRMRKVLRLFAMFLAIFWVYGKMGV